MDQFVRLNGQLVRLKTPADMRSSVLWAIGIFVVGNVIALGAFGIGEIAREPAPVDSWFAVTRPAASALLQTAPPEVLQWIMRAVAAAFFLFSWFMLFVGLPVEFKQQRQARAELIRSRSTNREHQTEEPVMHHCVRCGGVLGSADRFCESCGTPVAVATPTVCPRCQSAIRPGAAFCGACGATLTSGGPRAAAPPPTAWTPPGPQGSPAIGYAPPASPAYQQLPMTHGESGGWKIGAGYLLAFAGGIIGLAIGGHLWRASVTLPTGQKMPRYSSSTRTHGKIILVIASMATAFWVQMQQG